MPEAVMSVDHDKQSAIRLGEASVGFKGIVSSLDGAAATDGSSAAELEARLIEFGFLEGAHVTILHQGIIGKDPIAVRVENATVAIRRKDALAVTVIPIASET